MRQRIQKSFVYLGWIIKTSLLLIVTGLSLLTLPASALSTYSITTLPLLPGGTSSEVLGINGSGQVVG